ncbi:hypothetical protein AABB24_023018 [Solanum stoloniferum]|uniref:J domain-containing protein n=1 Tax=Solanum stoloniferum TaxID=62892 RepID=A0ABD2T2Q1_9SOLN
MEHPFFMNGAGNTSRAEAIRWLSIAEKLLTNRDLVGSKSFATRAHESDPTLLPADQILAIVDTLIAGDKRINNQHLDYYSILQIPSNQTHDSELIANQYRRLALLLNPQKNNFPFSDHAFHLVVDAWSVLSNAFRRSVYDKEIGFFLNLNPVSSPPPPTNNPVGFMQQSSMIFQSQPQSHPVSSVPSSSRERQTVTFLQDPQPQSMTSVSSLTREQQPVTFLSRNQTQPVNSTMLSPAREQHPFTFGSSTTRAQQQVAFAESTRGQQQVAFAESTRGPHQVAFAESTRGPQQVAFVESTRGQQQVASVESTRGQHRVASMESRREQQEVASVHQQGNKQAPQRNDGLLGNNQNFSASTGRNVNNEGLFGNNQNHSVSTGKNVNNAGLFGNNQNQSASTNRNVNNEGLFGSNQNQSANTSHNNVSNEVFFGNNQNHSISTSNNNVNNVGGKEKGTDASSHAVPSFWTACPYCYLMYEYPLEYVDCTLRCQKCNRAFQAVKITSPPPIIEGQEAYFCCWGFMPLGFSLEIFKKYKGNISSWTPFAPMFNKHGGVRKPSAPRVYIDDYEDVFLGLSESSEESDEDWKGDNKMKKAKSGKRKSKRIRRKKAKIQKSDKGKNVVGNAGDDVEDVSATQGGVEVPNVTTAQSSKRAGNTRRQAGRVTKDVGKLDLNVEFSNEVEEPPAPGMGQGNGAGTGEDGNIEGIEFFEGLDEFLSSLPILNAVGDDKVKAA